MPFFKIHSRWYTATSCATHSDLLRCLRYLSRCNNPDALKAGSDIFVVCVHGKSDINITHREEI